MKNETLIVCILDRSGSMNSIIDEAVGGINNFIETQQKLPGEAKIVIVLFDTDYEIPYNYCELKQVKLFTKNTYSPGGTTALWDAIGKTINNVGSKLNSLNEEDKPNKVLFCILTDGYENASKEFTAVKIKEMIKHQEEKYNWIFTYIGVGLEEMTDADIIDVSGCHRYSGTIGHTMNTMNLLYSNARMCKDADEVKDMLTTEVWKDNEHDL